MAMIDALLGALAGGGGGLIAGLNERQKQAQIAAEEQLKRDQLNELIRQHNLDALSKRDALQMRDFQNLRTNVDTAMKGLTPRIPANPDLKLPGVQGDVPSEGLVQAADLVGRGGEIGRLPMTANIPQAQVPLPVPSLSMPASPDQPPQAAPPTSLPGGAALSAMPPAFKTPSLDEMQKYLTGAEVRSKLEDNAKKGQDELKARAILQSGTPIENLTPDQLATIQRGNLMGVVNFMKPPPPHIQAGLGPTGQPGVFNIDTRKNTASPITFAQGGTMRPVPPASAQAQAAGATTVPTIVSQRPTADEAKQIIPGVGTSKGDIFINGEMNALTGRTPSMGLSGQPLIKAARDAIRASGAQMIIEAGVDPGVLQRDYQIHRAEISRLKPLYDATAGTAVIAKDELALAQQQAQQVGRFDAALPNKLLQYVQRGFTPAVGLTGFETAVYAAVREYARTVSGASSSIAGMTDSAVKAAEHILNVMQSPGGFDQAVQIMGRDLDIFVKDQTDILAKSTSPTLAKFYASVNGVQWNPTQAAPSAPPPPKPNQTGPAIPPGAIVRKVKGIDPKTGSIIYEK